MAIYSPFPDVDIPDVSLTEHVLDPAADRPDALAIVDGPTGRGLTYAELRDAIRALAGGLHARGIRRGDVVGLHLPNGPDYAIAFHALASIGATATTVNPSYIEEELAFQLRDARARALITTPPMLDEGREAAAELGFDEILVSGDVPGPEPSLEQVAAAGGDPPDVAIDPARDLAALPYSSGTTGLPKGVMLSHRNLVANIRQTEAAQRVTSDDVVIAVLPFFHIYGMQVLMNLSLAVGATVVTMPRFDLGGFLDLIESRRVTRAYVVPPIALALAKAPEVDDRDLSSIEVLFSGAAPLGAELAEACAQRLRCPVVQGYGMTETSPVTHAVPFGEPNRPGSIGPAVPNTECRLVDPDTGDDAPPDGRGELWIRGPQVMRGYLHNPEATAATVDPDGWLHTGDVAVVDGDGWFTIVDRLKELIKVKGFQVAPAELEALLQRHEQVADAAVVGVPDDEAGEAPRAYVVPRADGDHAALEATLRSYLGEHLAKYKWPRDVVFVAEIPKSPSGKILRRVLRERP